MTGMVGTDSRTMADLISLAAARHGGKPALKHKLGGEWVEVSYEQLDRTVTELALGLVDLGIEPGDRVSILSHTRPEWTYACFATFAAGAIVASIYQTNSAEECHYVLHHSGARAVFVEDAEQLAKVRAVEADLPALEFVIVMQSADADGSLLSLEVLRERGRGRPQAELEERVDGVTQDAACLFIYTSGTTGPPKACELTHGNYRAITSALETQDIVRVDECVYLFLPLAHALALVVQFLVLDVGATIAYWEKDPQKIVANLIELKPTFFRPCRGSSRRSIRWPRPPATLKSSSRQRGWGSRCAKRRLAARRSPPSCRRRSSAPTRPCTSTCATCSAGGCARR